MLLYHHTRRFSSTTPGPNLSQALKIHLFAPTAHSTNKPQTCEKTTRLVSPKRASDYSLASLPPANATRSVRNGQTGVHQATQERTDTHFLTIDSLRASTNYLHKVLHCTCACVSHTGATEYSHRIVVMLMDCPPPPLEKKRCT